jgi:hypothetical protein
MALRIKTQARRRCNIRNKQQCHKDESEKVNELKKLEKRKNRLKGNLIEAHEI